MSDHRIRLEIFIFSVSSCCFILNETWIDAANNHSDNRGNSMGVFTGDISRSKGMTQVARDAGLSRESLYKALSGERTPGFDTIL
jgi:probable addiction module antidote protein